MKSLLYLTVFVCLASIVVWAPQRVSYEEFRQESQWRATQIKSNELNIHQLVRLEPAYSQVLSASVKVEVTGGSGSGVFITRQVGEFVRTYVWTAGHVIDCLRNKDGSFRNAKIYREIREKGAYKDCEWFEARVIAYSNEEDLALLEILGDKLPSNSYPVSYTSFYYGDILPIGTELVHVGSAAGLYNSVSLGIMSQTDRDIEGCMYDQTTVMGYPGCSGGGVFTLDGECIGLLTRGGPGLNFIVPIRRMRAWAKEVDIEWALDHSIPVPLSRTPTDFESIPLDPAIDLSFDSIIDSINQRIKESF